MSDKDVFVGPSLKFLQINTQLLFPKHGELQVLASQVIPDILCVTDSWLSPAIPDGMVSLDNYTLYRFD